jgi:hypothetical protein
MQRMGGAEWQECMAIVLLPLLARLAATDVSPLDPLGIEESRVRAIALTCKQTLNHISELSASPQFVAVWLQVLYFMRSYMTVLAGGASELLREAIPESLKNMLLVAHSLRLFETVPGLYVQTKGEHARATVRVIGCSECVEHFLPGLVDELVPFTEGTSNPAAASGGDNSMNHVRAQHTQPAANLGYNVQQTVQLPFAEVRVSFQTCGVYIYSNRHHNIYKHNINFPHQLHSLKMRLRRAI